MLSAVACAPVGPKENKNHFAQYVASKEYRAHVTQEVVKVLPADLKNCGTSFADVQTQTLIKERVEFNSVANVALFTTHSYGNPVKGVWVEKQYILACGKSVGFEIWARAVPDQLPALDVKIKEGVQKDSFMQVPMSSFEKDMLKMQADSMKRFEQRKAQQ